MIKGNALIYIVFSPLSLLPSGEKRQWANTTEKTRGQLLLLKGGSDDSFFPLSSNSSSRIKLGRTKLILLNWKSIQNVEVLIGFWCWSLDCLGTFHVCLLFHSEWLPKQSFKGQASQPVGTICHLSQPSCSPLSSTTPLTAKTLSHLQEGSNLESFGCKWQS